MKKVRLGQTGLMVTEVSFGGIPIQRLSEDEAIEVVRQCVAMGINFIDTAHGYTTSEERIGKAIEGMRDDLILATKSHGLDAATFKSEMEQSFTALRTDYIDIFQFHNISSPAEYEQVMALGGPMDLVREAKEQGRIGHIGATSHSLEMAIQLVESGLFETLMFPFNYITCEPAEVLLPLCEKNDVGFISMKPMGGGLLDEAELSFRWLRQYPWAVPVVGIEKVSEMTEIIGIVEAGAALTDEQSAAIEAVRQELGNRFCRGCDYCQPCPQEIKIATTMRIKSFVKRMPAQRAFGPWGQEVIATAETCIDCGVCETRCPYELHIRETMHDNIAWYHEQQAAWAAR